MARSTRNTRKHEAAKKKPSKRIKAEPKEATLVLQPKDGNLDHSEPSSPSSTSEHKIKTTAAIPKNKNKNGRPPLSRKKVSCKKAIENDEGKDEEALSDDEASPLKKKKLLSRRYTVANAIAIAAASTPGRPRRRAAASKKKHQYADLDDSDTDNETSSSNEESDYGARTKSQARPIACSKTNKRKKGTPIPIARKISNTKKAKTKTLSPSARNVASSSPDKRKKTKSSPSVLSTPQGASIGLTPIKDSVDKVWKSDGGDWRVQEAIDYEEF
jgi:hypothetical protein